MIADIAAIIAPLFICAGVGVTWAKLGRSFDNELITGLVLNIGTPCLIFSTLTKLKVSPAVFAEIAGGYILAIACFAVIGAAVLKIFGLRFSAYLPSLMFGNNGNMGLPLCLFAFGQAGLAFAICTFVISALSNVTIGAAISSGREAAREFVRNPFVYVIILAFAFLLTETKPPAWLANTVELIGGLAIPMMLFALGVSLTRLRVAGFGRSAALAILRLAMGFAVGFAITEALGFTGALRGVLILQCSMPVAVVNSVYAQRYATAPEDVAGMVVISTAVSFATLPLLLLLVL